MLFIINNYKKVSYINKLEKKSIKKKSYYTWTLGLSFDCEIINNNTFFYNNICAKSVYYLQIILSIRCRECRNDTNTNDFNLDNTRRIFHPFSTTKCIPKCTPI